MTPACSAALAVTAESVSRMRCATCGTIDPTGGVHLIVTDDMVCHAWCCTPCAKKQINVGGSP